MSSRTPYEEGNVILHFASLEHILDDVFAKLHVSGASVEHPVLMTEPVAMPPYCRRECSELFFEAYSVPKACFAVDAPLAWKQNRPDEEHALIISIGNYTTVLSAVVRGETRPEWIRRINYGGRLASQMMLSLMQCKYPAFPVKMSPWQAEEVTHRCAAVALDYDQVLNEMATSDEALAARDITVQFPYSTETLEERMQKEAAREQLAERRREQAQKLREKAEKQKAEKIEAKRQQLESMKRLAKQVSSSSAVRSDGGFDDESEEQNWDQLRLFGYESLEELSAAIEAEGRELNRLLGIEEPKEEPDYSLLEVPDAELSPEQIKEKRKQRLLKNSAEAREKMKKEKEEQERRREEKRTAEEERRLRDFEGWKGDLYQERQAIMQRLKERQKRRDALADRRSQASGARLRNVVSLVADNGDDVEDEQVKGEKAGAKGAKKRKTAKSKDPGAGVGAEERGFGDDDADWLIYRQISRDDDVQAEEEEELGRRLGEIEERLEEHDKESFLDVVAAEMNLAVTVMDKLRTGISKEEVDPNAAANQLHINVERYRVTEGLFQPSSILGLEQAGLSEALEDLLRAVPVESKNLLLQKIFVTGGACRFEGLRERLEREIRCIAPIDVPIGIAFAGDPSLDAWKGAALLVRTASHSPTSSIPWITREWYQEHGGERLPGTRWFTNQF